MWTDFFLLLRPVGFAEVGVSRASFNDYIRAKDGSEGVALYFQHPECNFWKRRPTAAVHPLSAERSARSETSGSADALTPFSSNASVTLKSAGSKLCDRAHAADARKVKAAFILAAA